MPATTGTVTLINAFEVPPQADEPFIAGWQRARDFLATKDGFAATALHRARPTHSDAGGGTRTPTGLPTRT